MCWCEGRGRKGKRREEEGVGGKEEGEKKSEERTKGRKGVHMKLKCIKPRVEYDA